MERASCRPLRTRSSAGVSCKHNAHVLRTACMTTTTAAPSCRSGRVHRCIAVRAAQRPPTPRNRSYSGQSVLTEPLSRLDVDWELWQVLDLCTDEELETLYHILYGPSPLSPLVKSLVRESQPPLVEARGRTSIMHKVESRFRFLAADSSSTLSGQWPSYRQVLLSGRHRLGVSCSSQLSTPDLETELFVHILHHCAEAVVAEGDPDPRDAAAVAYAYEGDGMTSTSASGRLRHHSWTERLMAPFRFGGHELLPSLAKLGSALAVGVLGQHSARALGGQLVAQQLRFQAAAIAATSSTAGATVWQRQAALRTAQRALGLATARYSVLQGALGSLNLVLWGWAALDLARTALGTDYARVMRAVFVLAQVRLLATAGWGQPEGSAALLPWDEEDVPGVC